MSPPLLPAGHIECLEMEILARTIGHNENPPLVVADDLYWLFIKKSEIASFNYKGKLSGENDCASLTPSWLGIDCYYEIGVKRMRELDKSSSESPITIYLNFVLYIEAPPYHSVDCFLILRRGCRGPGDDPGSIATSSGDSTVGCHVVLASIEWITAHGRYFKC